MRKTWNDLDRSERNYLSRIRRGLINREIVKEGLWPARKGNRAIGTHIPRYFLLTDEVGREVEILVRFPVNPLGKPCTGERMSIVLCCYFKPGLVTPDQYRNKDYPEFDPDSLFRQVVMKYVTGGIAKVARKNKLLVYRFYGQDERPQPPPAPPTDNFGFMADDILHERRQKGRGKRSHGVIYSDRSCRSYCQGERHSKS